jgi:hypothetical protein
MGNGLHWEKCDHLEYCLFGAVWLDKEAILTMRILKDEDIIFVITTEELQDEAKEQIGRELDEEEIDIAINAFRWGMRTMAVDVIFNTIFTEMINENKN